MTLQKLERSASVETYRTRPERGAYVHASMLARSVEARVRSIRRRKMLIGTH